MLKNVQEETNLLYGLLQESTLTLKEIEDHSFDKAIVMTAGSFR